MSARDTADRRLATLERLRTLELEQAQAERMALDEAVRREHDSMAKLEHSIDDTREAARALIAPAQRFFAAALLDTGRYATWQAGMLDRQKATLQKAESVAEEARAAVVLGFKNLTVLEKLRERRGRERAIEALRQEQKTLDDQAILVLGTHSNDTAFIR